MLERGDVKRVSLHNEKLVAEERGIVGIDVVRSAVRFAETQRSGNARPRGHSTIARDPKSITYNTGQDVQHGSDVFCFEIHLLRGSA